MPLDVDRASDHIATSAREALWNGGMTGFMDPSIVGAQIREDRILGGQVYLNQILKIGD